MHHADSGRFAGLRVVEGAKMVVRDLRTIYQAPTREAAESVLTAFEERLPMIS